MHQTLLSCLGLLLAICLLVGLSRRLRIAYPILLVLGGLALSFWPRLPLLTLDPNLVFLIFLPPLLYESAWFTSWKDFWRWRRLIGFLAFGLVLLTSSLVAWVAWAVIPGFTLALGFLLGGIVSPPDAVAATSVMRGLTLPRRITAILEGESLVNDASSLLVFRVALAAVLSGAFSWQQAASDLLVVTGVGIAVGLGVALGLYAVHRWLRPSPSIHTVLTLVTPYLMYVLAESAHGSGVLAVVSGGLFLSAHSSRIFTPRSRQQGLSTWSTIGFVLNGTVFMLIGLQLPTIINGLGSYSKPQALGYGLLISSVLIVARLVITLLASPFSSLASRFIAVSDASPGWRGPLIVGYAGMRGVVSLAAALSLPLVGPYGLPFPQRNLLIFITFIVILVTLVGQGLTLPLLIRWLDVEDRDQVPSHPVQRITVHQQLAATALRYLEQRYQTQLRVNPLVRRLREQFARTVNLTTGYLQGETDVILAQEVANYQRIATDILHVQRQQLKRLKQQADYDDEVIRQHEMQLDLEAERVFLAVLPPETLPGQTDKQKDSVH